LRRWNCCGNSLYKEVPTRPLLSSEYPTSQAWTGDPSRRAAGKLRGVISNFDEADSINEDLPTICYKTPKSWMRGYAIVVEPQPC
jgi:hypothetical protein